MTFGPLASPDPGRPALWARSVSATMRLRTGEGVEMSVSLRRGVPVAARSPRGRPGSPDFAPEAGAAVQVSHLRKTYGTTVAVDDVSFSVGEGEIFGILGPNGAGKTTSVECVIGLRSPDAGLIRVMGLDPHVDREELHAIVGAQLQMAPVVRDIGDWTPLGASIQALEDSMRGAFPTAQSLLVLAAWAVVFGVLAVRFFRWE